MAEVLGEVVVRVRVDTSGMNSQLRNVKTNLNSSLGVWSKNITTFTRNFNKVARPIIMAAKAYTAAMTAFSVKALHALYTSNSAEGRAWKKTFDVFKARLNTEMARIGSMLLKAPIFGSTIPQWMDKIIEFMHNIDMNKLQKLITLFEAMAVTAVALRAISLTSGALAGLTKLAAMAGVGSGNFLSSALGSALGVGGVNAIRGIQKIDISKMQKLIASQYLMPVFTTPQSVNWNKGKEIFNSGIGGSLAPMELRFLKFQIVWTKVLGTLGLIGILIDQICIGWKEALEGVKIVLDTKLVQSIGGFYKKAFGEAGDVLNLIRGGAQATVTGAAAFAGTTSVKGGGNPFKAAEGAMENFWLKHFFKKEMTPWQKPIKEDVGSSSFTGKYIGLTEGVKLSQEMQKKDNAIIKELAKSNKTLDSINKHLTPNPN